MTKKSRTPSGVDQAQITRSLPVGSLEIDPRATLLELAVATGLQVLHAMLEEDRAQLCGPRYQHQVGRAATRAGTTTGEVVLGGRKIAIRRPRVRGAGGEVALPTLQAMRGNELLSARTVEQMLVGVATRQYARSLEPVGATVRTRGISRSAVSRRFVAATHANVATWQSRSLEGLDVVALFVDGVRFAKDCLVVALGITTNGEKHVLGLWDGSTENSAVCQSLLTNLVERGLRSDRSLVVVLDGSRALRKAIDQTFGVAACVQRCQIHKQRNVLHHLPKHRQAWARTILQRAYHSGNAAQATRLLEGFATTLDRNYPSAATSLREGLDETLTVLTLPVGDTLRRALATTNTIESLMGRLRAVHRHVKRWRGRRMALRWAVAGLHEATTHFKRFNGYRDMRALVNALRARDTEVGLKPAATAA